MPLYTTATRTLTFVMITTLWALVAFVPDIGSAWVIRRLAPVINFDSGLQSTTAIPVDTSSTCGLTQSNGTRCWEANPITGRSSERLTQYVAQAAGIAVTPSVRFSAATYSVNENGSVGITVLLSALTTQTVTINYASSNGTAIAGSDYTTISGTLSFNPGETSKNFSIPILDDALAESNETIYLALSNPFNAT